MNAVLDFTFQSAASNYAKGFSARRSDGAVRGRRPVHDADDERAGAAHVPRQPRHGPHRVLREGRDRPGAALRAGALAHVPDAGPARRLLRRRAGLRRRRHAERRNATRTPASRCSPRRWPSTRTRTCSTGRSRARSTGTTPTRRCTTTSPSWPRCAAARPALQHGAQIERLRRRRGLRVLAGSTPTRRSSTSSRRTTAPTPATVTIDTLTPGRDVRAAVRDVDGRDGGRRRDRRGDDPRPERDRAQGRRHRSALRPPRVPSRVTAPTPGAGLLGRRRRSAPTSPTTSGARRRSPTAWWATTHWTPLGTSETTSPRVFHTSPDLPDGALVEYRAVTVDAAGHRSAASTFGERRRRRRRRGRPGAADPGRGPVVSVPGSHNTRDGLPGRLAARLRRRAQLTKGADGIYSGTFTLPAGTLRVQGRDRRHVGRELRRGRRRRAARTSTYTVADDGAA